MKIAKKLEWLLPYIERAKKDHPKIAKRLKKVYYIKTDTKNRHSYFGICIHNENGSIHIGLRDRYQAFRFHDDGHISVSIKPMSKIDMIELLAHELAHVYYIPHSPKHKKLECRIKTKFCTMLEKEGYISEEEELG